MKKQRETQKTRYATLAQFIALANLFEPQREYPALVSLDEPIDRNFHDFEATPTPELTPDECAAFLRLERLDFETIKFRTRAKTHVAIDAAWEPLTGVAKEKEQKRAEAYAVYEQALAAKSEILEPLWERAVELFPATDFAFNDGTPRAAIAGHLFRNSDELYGAALAVRDALRTLAAKRDEKLPIKLLPAAPHGIQIVAGVIYPAPDLVRDLLLPALAGVNIELIQLCPNCGKLVLAARQRKHQACSPECANAERVKRFRNDNPDYYTAVARRTRKKIAERAAKRRAQRKAQ